MRILIIALPRTGSTSLMIKYSKENKLRYYFEPFEPLDTKIVPTTDNILVKTMMYHIPSGYDNAVSAYAELSKQFDKVILLSRRDLVECAESWAYLQHHNHKNFNSLMHYIWKTPPNIEKHTADVYRWNEELLHLSRMLNIGITYYEDIFDKNSNERYRKNVQIDKIGLI